jgi:hypothetical protein
LHRCIFVPADEYLFGFLFLTSTLYFQLGSGSGLDIIKYPTCSNTCSLAEIFMTPYDIYKNTEEWRIINKAIQELIDNSDIKLLTPNDYIIRYIVKLLVENGKRPDNMNNVVD